MKRTNGDDYTIAVAQVTNLKRISSVRIEPRADTNVLLLGGKNTNGKTSLMDALTIAFYGVDAIPNDAIRHGAAAAEVEVHLTRLRNGDTYRIERTIAPPTAAKARYKATLKITGPDGPLGVPQSWLNRLVGERFITDPVAFTTKPAAEQRAILLTALGIDVASLDEEYDRLYKERTGVSRLLKQAETIRARITPPDEPPMEARAISQIHAELESVATQRRAADDLRATHASLTGKLASIDQVINGNHAEIAKLEAQLAAARSLLATNMERRAASAALVADALARVPDADAFAAFQSRSDALRTEANRSELYARWTAGAASIRRQIANAEAEIQTHSVEEDRINDRMRAITGEKAALLAAAAIPIPGLEITDDGICLGGALFANASQAEQLRCSIAIARLQSPHLRDVWVRDGSRLDDDSLEILRQIADEMQCRVWVERVGERDPGAIIIRDGKVLGAEESAS